MALITISDISVGYEGKAVASGLNFTVGEKDYLCLLGENGVGKSTLMKTILGLQPPLDGRIERGDGLLAKEIGYLPQQTVVQRDFPASVWEIVLSGFQGHSGISPFYRVEEKANAEENLRRLGIQDLRKRCYRELSGGQQQRVLLARALCATRRILLLDEPAAGLDPKATLEMYRLIEDLNRNDGIAVIMVTHDIDAALKYARHILHIGRRTFFGTKEEYMESDIGKRFISMEGGNYVERH